MRAKTGTLSRRGALSVPGMGIFHIGPDGIYLFGSGNDKKITEDAFEPVFRGESMHGLPAVGDLSTAWLHLYRNHRYCGFPGEGSDWSANVLVTNLDTGRVAYYAYPQAFLCFATDHKNTWLLSGGEDGFVRRLESPTLTDDDGAAISWEVQSKDFLLQTRLRFPRWLKYDVDASSAATLLRSVVPRWHIASHAHDQREQRDAASIDGHRKR